MRGLRRSRRLLGANFYGFPRSNLEACYIYAGALGIEDIRVLDN